MCTIPLMVSTFSPPPNVDQAIHLLFLNLDFLNFLKLLHRLFGGFSMAVRQWDESQVMCSYHYYCMTDSFFFFQSSCSNVSQTLPTSATFNFPIYISLADKFGEVELIVWDKDMLISQVELMCTDYCDGGPTKN